jgi:hypothetical protein
MVRGWPWTPLSFNRARYALPFYALRVGHPSNGLAAVSGVAHLQVGPTHKAGGLRSSSSPLDTPRRTPMETTKTSATAKVGKNLLLNIAVNFRASFAETASAVQIFK